MPKGTSPNKKNRKGKPQDFDWEQWADPLCVAEPGWEEEPAKVWDCAMCKKYVKMVHLAKIWPQERALKQAKRWEGQTSTCESKHFRDRYVEIQRTLSVSSVKYNVMNYNIMAMVWAEIVLHKDVDWRTTTGRNLTHYTREDAVIDTQWVGPSDCMPEWSNRGQLSQPPVVLRDAEDPWTDDEDDDNARPPKTGGERHERQDERERIVYDQEMQEAMRRSLQDRGRQHGYGGSYGSNQREHGSREEQQGRRSSYYNDNPHAGSQGGERSHGTGQYGGSSGGSSYYGTPFEAGSQGATGSYGSSHYGQQYGGSTQGGSHYYYGSTGSDTYGHHGGSSYGGSGERAPAHSAPVPPPTFGGPNYNNYGQGGGRSGYGEYYGGGPFIGIQARGPSEQNESDSESE